MINISSVQNVSNFIDGICATNKISYAAVCRTFTITKRSLYLWRKYNKLPSKELHRTKLQELTEKTGKSVEELERVGNMCNHIRKYRIAKIISYILMTKKLKQKELAETLNVTRALLDSAMNKNAYEQNRRNSTNFFSYQLAKYCVDNSIDLKNVESAPLFDVRKLNNQELSNLIYGLLKVLELNTYDLNKYGLQDNTVCRWLLGKSIILQYKDVGMLLELILKTGKSIDELISIGSSVSKEIRKLEAQNNWEITSCNFKIDNNAEKLLYDRLKSIYSGYEILHKVRISKNNEKFEADFIAFDEKETLWFEITEIVNTSSFPGNLDMRVLRIKELLKPTKIVLIRRVETNTGALLRYSRLLRLGIFTCSIDGITEIDKVIEEQEKLMELSKTLLYNPIKTSHELRIFRMYCLSMSKNQFAALLNGNSIRSSVLEYKLKLPTHITAQVSEVQELLRLGKPVRELHRLSNNKLRLETTQCNKILRQTNFKDNLEKDLFEHLSSKFEVYHNVVLANKEVTIVSEADLFIPAFDVIVDCKNSINRHSGTFIKVLWSLQRFRRITKNVVLYVPNATERIVNVFKKNGIAIAKNKEELLFIIQGLQENERQRNQKLVQEGSPEEPRKVLPLCRVKGDGI
ncbi:hypothetical protein HYY73_05625 [Candidatus Woesearchaeota archaeon]|nr:hypothetical protein [Candidatus Woesearchaeota archaeon]